jgi:hypothetical protein
MNRTSPPLDVTAESNDVDNAAAALELMNALYAYRHGTHFQGSTWPHALRAKEYIDLLSSLMDTTSTERKGFMQRTVTTYSKPTTKLLDDSIPITRIVPLGLDDFDAAQISLRNQISNKYAGDLDRIDNFLIVAFRRVAQDTVKGLADMPPDSVPNVSFPQFDQGLDQLRFVGNLHTLALK